MDYGRNVISDFLKKAYELVDDPSTDSIISWAPSGCSFLVLNPLECSRDLLTRRLQITNFGRFETYGFRKIVPSSGQQLEFACNDFVRGKPELLERIAERYVANMKEYEERKYGALNKRLKNATSREEYDLAIKEQREIFAKESRERKARMPPPQVTSTIPPFIDLAHGKNYVIDFLKKAYELVDDPSTDSIISWAPHGRSFVVWKPLECCRDLLPQHLQSTNFTRFQIYGFTKTVVSSGQQLEFACTDFVRGKPELLEKIAKRYVPQLKGAEFGALNERLKNATSEEEYDLAIKEIVARKSKKRKEIMAGRRVVTSYPAHVLEDQVYHLRI